MRITSVGKKPFSTRKQMLWRLPILIRMKSDYPGKPLYGLLRSISVKYPVISLPHWPSRLEDRISQERPALKQSTQTFRQVCIAPAPHKGSERACTWLQRKAKYRLLSKHSLLKSIHAVMSTKEYQCNFFSQFAINCTTCDPVGENVDSLTFTSAYVPTGELAVCVEVTTSPPFPLTVTFLRKIGLFEFITISVLL